MKLAAVLSIILMSYALSARAQDNSCVILKKTSLGGYQGGWPNEPDVSAEQLQCKQLARRAHFSYWTSDIETTFQQSTSATGDLTNTEFKTFICYGCDQ